MKLKYVQLESPDTALIYTLSKIIEISLKLSFSIHLKTLMLMLATTSSTSLLLIIYTVVYIVLDELLLIIFNIMANGQK